MASLRDFASTQAAIVGAGCRLPGANSLEAFWNLLKSGGNAVSLRPEGRWSVERFLRQGPPEPGFSYTFAGGYIDDPYAFDPAPFGIAPREAQQMDPQQRLLLEVVWSALEDAGIAPSSIAKQNVGVYVGASTVDYQSGASHDPAVMESHFMTGNSLSILANRVSYAFDLRGPSLTVDSACSSSIAALSLALDALRDGQIDMAIVGGVNLLLSPAPFVGFSQARMLSPTGLSRPFSRDADGYVRSEGAVVLILRRLEDAAARSERVRSVIAGVAMNSDGRTSGISLPSADGQRILIESLYAGMGIDPQHLAFVEAHGTGTKVGDPIEAAAIGEALGRRRSTPLPIGSVKSNIGHLEAASGLAGLLKASLALQNRMLPQSLFLGDLNENIDFPGLNLAPAAEPVRLDQSGEPLWAGVCNYGFGGTNAHVVLRSPPCAAQAPVKKLRPAKVLLLSAATTEALRAQALLMADVIDAGVPAEEIAASLGFQREIMNCRLALPLGGDDFAVPLALALRDFARNSGFTAASSATATALSGNGKLAFVYSGNGCQFAEMGRAAYLTSAAFRQEIEAIDHAFQPIGGWSIEEALRNGVSEERLCQSSISQPLIFAVQSALTAAFVASGVRPDIVIGHSVGEVAAAEASGALSRSDALLVVHHRSRQQELMRGQGGMLALIADAKTARARLDEFADPSIDIAAINGPNSTTIAGNADSLQAFAAYCRKQKLATKDLKIDYPFHSPALDPIGPAIVAALKAIDPGAAATQMISTVTGLNVAGPDLDSTYWWLNVRRPVRFEAAVQEAIHQGASIFVEIGPRAILTASIAEILRSSSSQGVALPSLSLKGGETPDPVTLAIARIVAHGGAFEAEALFGSKPVGATPLPGYPFQRQNYNLPATSEALNAFGQMWNAVPRHPLLGSRMAGGSPEWRSLIDIALVPYLGDHRVDGNVIVPASALIDAALAAGRDIFGKGPLELDELDIFKALSLQSGETRELSTRFAEQTGSIEIWSRKRFSPDQWVLHARGVLRKLKRSRQQPLAPPDPAQKIIDSPGDVYAEAARAGLEYGPLFRLVVQSERDCVTNAAILAEPLGGLGAFGDQHVLHPVSVDAAFHGLFISRPQRDGEMKAHLPVRFRKIRVWEQSARIQRCITLLTHETKGSKTISVSLLGEDGRLVASIEAAVLRAVYLSSNQLSERTFHARPILLTPSLAGGALEQSRLELASARPELPPVWLLLRAFAISLAHQTVSNLLDGDIDGRVDDLCTTGRVASGAVPLFETLREVLDAFGALNAEGGGFKLAADLKLPSPEALLSTLIRSFPQSNFEIRLAASAIAHLETILRSGVHLLEPQQMLQRAELDGVLFKPAIEALARSVAILSCQADRPLRVLALAPWGGGLKRALTPAVNDGSIELTIGVPDLALAEEHRRAPGASAVDVMVLNGSPSGSTVKFDALVFICAPTAGIGESELLTRAMPFMADNAPVLAARFGSDATLGLLCGVWGVELSRRAVLKQLRDAGVQDLVTSQVADSLGEMITGRTHAAPEQTRAGSSVAVLGLAEMSGLSDVVQIELRDLPVGLASWLASISLDKKPVLVVPPAAQRSSSVDVAAQIELLRSLFLAIETIGRNVKVCVITAGAHDGHSVHAPYEAALWGFARVAINEFPSIDLRLIDLAPHASSDSVATLIEQDCDEREWIVKPQGISVNRIRRGLLSMEKVDDASRSLLQFDKPGRLDSFVWRMADRRELRQGEVEVEIAAAGLNYRDILIGMGAIDEDLLGAGLTGAALGFECSGTIVRVGPDVRSLAVGDQVMGFGAGAFTSHLVAPELNFFAVPKGVSLEAAATIPVAFATAWYALVDRANLQPGESVLIHGAAGGVGLAALQIAKRIGAQAIGTASNDARRAIARAAGAAHAFPSRNESFVEAVEKTFGGIDVVLNSLAGQGMLASLKLVKPFGRFIELGKRDFLENTPLGLRPFVRNISYSGVDLDELLAHDPARVRAIMAEICDLLAKGELSPLPHQIYESHEIDAAFRSMQASEHVGKIVFRPARAGERDVGALDYSAPPGAYVIFGGTSGLGFATARWLARKGATTLVLASRRGALADGLADEVAAMQRSGARVLVEAVDVLDTEAVRELIKRVSVDHGGLRGIVHAAVTLDDGLISGLTPDRLNAVLRTKIDGVLNLDAASRDEELDMFVVYSSATTLIGSPGQSAYVAANAFLEGFVRRRRAMGLPALSVGWGAISDVGIVARDQQLGERLRRTSGVAGVSSSAALAHLGRLLALGDSIDPVQFYTNIAPVAAAAKLSLLKSPTHAGLGLTLGATADEGSRNLAAKVKGKGRSEALALVTAALRYEVAHILRMHEEQVDAGRPLSDLGLDSLMALELHLSIEQLTGAKVAMIGGSDLSLPEIAALVLDQILDEGEPETEGILEQTSMKIMAMAQAHSSNRMNRQEAREAKPLLSAAESIES